MRSPPPLPPGTGEDAPDKAPARVCAPTDAHRPDNMPACGLAQPSDDDEAPLPTTAYGAAAAPTDAHDHGIKRKSRAAAGANAPRPFKTPSDVAVQLLRWGGRGVFGWCDRGPPAS